MERFLIEVPHEEDPGECARALGRVQVCNPNPKG